MNIRVKLFAAARDLAKTGDLELSLPDGATAATVLQVLTDRYPEFTEWKNYLRVSINWEYASLNQSLHNGDEIAIIPPVSGG